MTTARDAGPQQVKKDVFQELKELNRIYNLFVWGCIVCAWFAISMMAYDIVLERGWL